MIETMIEGFKYASYNIQFRDYSQMQCCENTDICNLTSLYLSQRRL